MRDPKETPVDSLMENREAREAMVELRSGW